PVTDHCDQLLVNDEYDCAVINLLLGMVTYDSLSQLSQLSELQASQHLMDIETALYQSEETLKLFIKYVPVGIVILDLNLCYVHASQRWVDDYRLESVEAIIGKSHYEVFPEIPENWRQIHQRCLKGAIERSEQDLFVRADGTHQWIRWEIRPWHTSNQEIGGVIFFSEDISERVQAEINLQESEERLRMALKAANQGLYDLNLRTGEAIVNPEYATMLGYDHDSFVETNTKWIDRMHPEDREIVENIYHEYISGNLPEYKVEFRQLTQSSEWKWILSLGKIVEWDEVGNPLRMLGTHTDISERKLAEEQAQCRLDILEAARDVIASADVEGRVTFINQTGKLILGIDPTTDIYNTRIPDYHPPHIAELILQEALPKCVQQGFWAGETLFCRKDGSEFPALQVIVCHRGSDHKINQFSTIARDISDLKQAEKERLLNEQVQRELKLLENILDIVLAGYWDWYITKHYEYFSPRFKQMFGYEDHEIANLPESWQQLIFPDDLPKAIEAFESHVQSRGEIPYCIEVRYRHKNGSTVWVICSGKVIEWDVEGNPIRMIGCHIDISDRKQAEADLRNLSDRLTLAVKSAAIGIWDWDVIQNVLQWDDRMYELYGLKSEQFANAYEAWASTLHPEDRINTENAIQQALQGEKEYDPEFRVVLPDGTSRFIKAYSLVQRNAKGEPLRMVGVNFDISDRRQAEARIQQTTAQLEASNRELEAFAYSVSHDLRAPLRAIDGFSNALMEDYADKFDEDGRDYFERIRRNIQRMGLLIDDLLRLSRVSRSEMQYSQINLSNLVQEQIHELQESAPQRQLEVVIAPEIVVFADVTLMRVIITNLIQNAWKFTSHHASARIEFGTINQDEQSIYFVRDDGAGFDMKYSKMLFGVFQRIHNTNEFPGTGIGLATVQRIIHRHGGKVWAEGEVEKGATIYFTLPNNSIRI
ncbi:MAG: PAS domain-containing protein, partial [Pseudanabaena sp.]